MTRIGTAFVETLLLVLLISPDSWAQATAQINGTVVDVSGGVLPGATVTAIQTDTGLRREVVSSETGSYTLTNLPIGPYRLEVSLPGFSNYQRTGIVLQVDSGPTVNVTLQLGELTETVPVTAIAPLVETRSPSVGTVIENERIEALPLNGRNTADLIQLAGAAVRTGGPSTRAMQGTVAYAVAGGPAFGVTYLLDGAIHNNPYDNLNLPLPFPDATQEFRLETSSRNAASGMHGGGAVSIVTKSGTNSLRGDLFEFMRDHRLNATNPFNAVDRTTGRRRGDGLKRHQFGGTLGGPLVRNRVFYFGAYQATRADLQPSDTVQFVPTQAMLAGDFSQIASAACNTRGAITLPAPFAGNQIDPALLNPVSIRIVRQLPTTSDPCGRVSVPFPQEIKEDQAIGRLDYQLTTSQSVFGRYMATAYRYAPPFSTSENVLSTTVAGRDNLAQSVVLGHTSILGSTTVNNLRFAFNRTAVARTATTFFDMGSIGINSYSYVPGFMILTVQGGFNLGGAGSNPATFRTNSFTINNDLSLIRGSHQLQFGVAQTWWASQSRANVRSPGVFTFDGGVTGIGLADFMLGRSFSYVQSAPNILDVKQNHLGLYAQDTWRISPSITLNYGLRWEPWFPQQVQNDAVYNFSPERFRSGQRSSVFTQAPPGFTYPGDQGFPGHSGMHPDWLNFTPRIGFAWDPNSDGRMVARVGYGMNGDFVNGQFYINAANAPPWGSEVRLIRPNVGPFEDPFRGTSVTNPFPVTFDANARFSAAGPFLATPSDLKTTRVHSWNATVQRQIGNELAVSISYIGTRTNNLWNVVTGNPGTIPAGGPNAPCTLNTITGPQTFTPCSSAPLDVRREITQLNPAIGQFIGFLDYFTDHGWQQYNGMLLAVQRRLANGFSGAANYTFSKCTGLPENGGGGNERGIPGAGGGYMIPASIINPPTDVNARLDIDKGPCDSDVRHIFNLTASVQTPQFSGTAARLIGSGWQLSGIFRAASGSRLNVTTGIDRALTGNPGPQRPNLVSDNPYGAKTLNQWFNPAAFAQPVLGTFGNSGRNAYEGPGSRVVDVSLVRSFRFSETRRIQARVEAFNLFNQFAWGNPATVLTDPNFGRILSAGDPRIVQLALKYEF
jgi:hypothetical protein